MRFDSPEHMEYLEAVDVEDDEYKAWDATGRVLLLTASHISRLSSGNIVVSSTEVTEDSGKFNKLIQIAKKVS